jgi:MarR family transcriptional regulator, organic hydroperoxide resistance regulator
MHRGLGTQLRHLIELLDGAVADRYAEVGLGYRPRYTPVMRALIEQEPQTLGQIAQHAGITQPAATQTVALMAKEGWVSVEAAASDARQRVISLTEQGRSALPKLQACWQATRRAADELDAELSVPLSQVLGEAITALEKRSFGERIARHARAPEKPATAARKTRST